MNKQTLFTILLSLVAVAGLAKTKTAEVKADSLLCRLVTVACSSITPLRR